MRFLMLMIPSVYRPENSHKLSEAFAPPVEMVEKMMKYNEKLAQAGALIALDGLQPPSAAGRVTFPGGKARATDGPFPEAKEVVGGYWIIRADSREAAMDWAMQVPALEGDIVEVRPIFDMEEFPEDIQKAADSDIVREAIGQQ